MKTNKIVLGLPLMFSLLLAGCSAGETPSLPDSSSSSKEATETAYPTSSPSGTSTSSPNATESTAEGIVTPPAPTTDTGKDVPGVKPYSYSTVPATASPPVYIEESPTEQGNPADSNAAFAVYASFHAALMASDWSKACDYVEIGEGKNKQFCVDWYEKNKAVTTPAPKLEDFNVRQEINSNSILLVSKDPKNVNQRHIRINPSDTGWKVVISPITQDS